MFDNSIFYFKYQRFACCFVEVCIKWEQGLFDLRDMFMVISRRIIVYGAMKLMDNDIF